MTDSEKPPVSMGYQLFMLSLCLYALGALALQTAIRLEPRTQEVLDYADYAVCALFLLDFVIILWRSRNRWRFFVTWGWLDLLSSIPSLDIARWGRVARVVRVFRVLRGLRATKIVAALVLQRRAESTLLAASLASLLLVITCSIAVLHFEGDSNPNIKTAEDAIWWAFSTITTVGYGDCYPMTSEGRFVAAILMSAGVGLFGTFSGFLAAWFIGSGRTAEVAEDSTLKAEMSELRNDIAALRRLLDNAGKDGTA